MSEQPKEIPKPLVEYPTVYAYKVMGKRVGEFHAMVQHLIAGALGRPVGDDAIVENISKQGHYVSLTVSVRLENEAERIAIYTAIHNEKRIVYYL